jgi:hypothetical protein
MLIFVLHTQNEPTRRSTPTGKGQSPPPSDGSVRRKVIRLDRHIRLVKYTFDNTCLLSVYSYPIWEMVSGVKSMEYRSSQCTFEHVIVSSTKSEDTSNGIAECPDWMVSHRGSAYLVFTIGPFRRLVGNRPVGWTMLDVRVLREPLKLGCGEYPKQGPCRLDPKKAGHVILLDTFNNEQCTFSLA